MQQQSSPTVWQDVMNALNIKTPAQQARAKVYWHLFLLFIINVGLAALAFADQFHTIKPTDLIFSAVSTGIMAMLDVLREYYVASGQAGKATLVSAARAEVQARVPVAPVLNANEQAFANAAKIMLPVAPSLPVTDNPILQNAAFQAQESLPNIQTYSASTKAQGSVADAPTQQFQTPGTVKTP